MPDFINILENFGVAVFCLIALAVFTNNMVNKLIMLTEKVTAAMVENAGNMATLSNTIEKLLTYIHEEKE